MVDVVAPFVLGDVSHRVAAGHLRARGTHNRPHNWFGARSYEVMREQFPIDQNRDALVRLFQAELRRTRRLPHEEQRSADKQGATSAKHSSLLRRRHNNLLQPFVCVCLQADLSKVKPDEAARARDYARDCSLPNRGTPRAACDRHA